MASNTTHIKVFIDYLFYCQILFLLSSVISARAAAWPFHGDVTAVFSH